MQPSKFEHTSLKLKEDSSTERRFALTSKLTELLHEQERLLERAMTPDDLVLYEVRSQRISDLIQCLGTEGATQSLSLPGLELPRVRHGRTRVLIQALALWFSRSREWAFSRFFPASKRPQTARLVLGK